MIRSFPMLATVLLPLGAAAVAPAGCRDGRPPVGQPCRVSHVSDGDSFTCGDGRRVRLIGIDAPELAQGAGGRRSRDALRRHLPRGDVVELEGDVAPHDRYGRRLAYVWRDGELINERMVLDGWAVLLTIPPNVKHAERLRAALGAAREARAGLWADNGFDCAPGDFRRGRC